MLVLLPINYNIATIDGKQDRFCKWVIILHILKYWVNCP